MLAEYARIILQTDRFAAQDVRRGNYEVEFSDPSTGISIAQVVAAEAELEAAPEDDVPSPRRFES